MKLICSRAYPAQKVHEEIFKMEVERLVILGVLEREMTNNGDPHPLHNQKLNQLKYIFQVT